MPYVALKEQTQMTIKIKQGKAKSMKKVILIKMDNVFEIQKSY